MRHVVMFLATFIALLISIGNAPADDAPENLQQIMQTLNADTLTLTTALMTEDWHAVEEAATAIADHPKVPMRQRMTIVSYLGARASEFREFDMVVHDAAVAIANAAEDGDIGTATKEYGIMIDGCLSCHADFRSEIRALRENGATTKNEMKD